MSQKYKLVADNDSDGVWASIKRHLTLASILIVAPLLAAIALTTISIFTEFRQQAIAESNRASIVMTRAARPTATPRIPTPITPFHTLTNRPVKLYDGPGIWYPSTRLIGANQPVVLVGRNQWGDWFQLDNNAWISKPFVVNHTLDLPITSPP